MKQILKNSWVICVARDEINGFDNQAFTVIDC